MFSNDKDAEAAKGGLFIDSDKNTRMVNCFRGNGPLFMNRVLYIHFNAIYQ